jgi:hypothetical protein
MNTKLLIDKLKEKITETNECVESTNAMQKKLLSHAKEFNFKVRNYLEGDINEKNYFADSQEKLAIVKTRIESCKQNIANIKDKLKNIKNKYDI